MPLKQLDARWLLGAGYAALAVGWIVYQLLSSSVQVGWTFALFLVVYVLIEWRTAELDDRLYGSGAVMLLLAVGVAFGESSPITPMVITAAAGFLTRSDVTQRRVFQPAVNAGQLAVSATAAGVTLHVIFDGGVSPTHGPVALAVGAATAGIVYSFFNFAQVALIVQIVYGRESVPPWSHLGRILPAYAVLSAVGGLLGATYVIVGPEVTPYIVVMVLMAHFAATSYAGVRESRNSTMRGFIKALEARDLFTRGHNERTASFARMICEELGLSHERAERIRWAVLLSDVSSLAVPRDLVEHQDHLTPEEEAQLTTYTDAVDDMLSQVEFLRPAMEIVRRRDFSRPPRITDELSLDAHILGVAKRFDHLTTGGSRAEAMRQHEAFDELRMSRKRRYAWEVVDALERAIEKAGMTYGKIDLANKLTAEDIAKQRMYERR